MRVVVGSSRVVRWGLAVTILAVVVLVLASALLRQEEQRPAPGRPAPGGPLSGKEQEHLPAARAAVAARSSDQDPPTRNGTAASEAGASEAGESLRLPTIRDYREQVARHPHEIPPAVPAFARELARRRHEATSPAQRRRLLDELGECVLRPDAVVSLRALCLSVAADLGALESGLRPEVVRLEQEAPEPVRRLAELTDRRR